MNTLQWQCMAFDDLSLNQLYALMRLRQQVFVVEQNCPFVDADNFDQASTHVLGYTHTGDLAAYCRLVPPDIIYLNESSIGRVITASAYRKFNYGRELMRLAIEIIRNKYPKHAVRIGAQYYLLQFYQSFGFEISGEPYLEDDILHSEMVLCPLA